MAHRRKRSVTAATASQKQPDALPQPGPPIDWKDSCVGAVVAAIAIAVYASSAARDIILGDTPELMTAAIRLGVVHPPGYPVFTLLGHLFSLLPFGPLPFRVNLLAVVCDAGAVALVYFTALRLTGNRLASTCAALVLAFTPLFWSWSLVAEVF